MGTDPSEILRERGLRVTAQRLAVLRAVSQAPHATADAVAQTVRGEIGSVSIQAVYDALAILTEKGLLRRIQPAGRRLGTRTASGTTTTTSSAGSASGWSTSTARSATPPCLTAAEDFGFEIDEAEVVYWGRCPECVRSREGTERTAKGTP